MGNKGPSYSGKASSRGGGKKLAIKRQKAAAAGVRQMGRVDRTRMANDPHWKSTKDALGRPRGAKRAAKSAIDTYKP